MPRTAGKKRTPAPANAPHVTKSSHAATRDGASPAVGYAGNRAALRRLSGSARAVQMKLTVGAANDPLEAEADRAADHVMRMASTQTPLSDAPPQISRKCSHCEEEDRKVNAKPDGKQALGAEAPAIVSQVLESPGQPLDSATRAFMEPRFGRAFDQVRVHADARAAESAQSVGALAYASGKHIAFGAGSYAPSSAAGQRLMAHELAHVVQQGEAPTVRRACGPEGIGAPVGCESGPAVFTPGPTFRFVVNCDDWADGADAGLLDSVQAIPATSNIQIDGYASSEGPEALNANLACARAFKAKSLLMAAKVPEARISKVVAHGATPGKADDRRSVVVQAANAPAAPGAAPPAAGQQQPGAPAPGTQGPAAQQPGAQGPALPPPLAPRKDVLEPGGATANAATRDDATKALTDYLNRAQTAQGSQAVQITPPVATALRNLFVGDPMGGASLEGILSRSTGVPGKPAELAAAVTKFLPDTMPKSRFAHLATDAVTASKDPNPKSFGDAVGKVLVESTVVPILKQLKVPADVQKTIIDGLRDATSDLLVALTDAAMTNAPLDDKTKAAIHSAIENAVKYPTTAPPDKRKDPAGDPDNPPQGPPAQDVSVQEANRHDIKSPAIPVSPPPAKDAPKPDVPKPVNPADAGSVDAIIQALDDTAFLPAGSAAADTAKYGGAKDIARNIAMMMSATSKEKSPTTVRVTLTSEYKGAKDLGDVYTKVGDVAKRIAAAMPGGAPNVVVVIVARAAAPGETTIPMERPVQIH